MGGGWAVGTVGRVCVGVGGEYVCVGVCVCVAVSGVMCGVCVCECLCVCMCKCEYVHLCVSVREYKMYIWNGNHNSRL